MNIKFGITFSVLLPIILFIFDGCSLDYSEAILEKELAENIPDMIFLDLKHTEVKNGVTAASVKAESAESYTKRGEILIEKVHFIEYSIEGKIVNEGWADKAKYEEKSGNAVIEGNIFVKSDKEQGSITAEKLFWSDREKELKGEADEEVLLKRDDGSYIRGKGFVADFKLKSFSFSKAVSGKYEDKNKE